MADYYTDIEDRITSRLQKDTEYAAAMLDRLKVRKKNHPLYGKESEEDRLWLEGFTSGDGLNICCGDFSIGDSLGVDAHRARLAADYPGEGDKLTFQGSDVLDFIITNYFEAMHSPLDALNEWYRCLKDGGVLAIVCMNADSYPPTKTSGALKNKNRYNTFTEVTVSQYLYRAGFSSVNVEVTPHQTMRVSAVKRRES